VRDEEGPNEEGIVHDAIDRLLAEHPPATTSFTDFLGAQFDAGLAWIQFPEGKGGLGLSAGLQSVVKRRLDEAGAPDGFLRNPIGYGMGGPTVLAHGSEAQQARYLRPNFTCEEVWCQLFSEPGAGSDVASLATSARRSTSEVGADEWIVNGQKVWTTLAHKARWGMLLARTDPDVPKHDGLTYFVVDMHAPGVDVRPLRQMSGEAEFNEVYFTDVRIPDAERLGGVGDGWRVSTTTLMNERYNMPTATRRGEGAIANAVDAWRCGGRVAESRDRLVRAWIEAEVGRLTALRAGQARAMGSPGPEGSVGKLGLANISLAVSELGVDLAGASGMLYDSYDVRHGDAPPPSSMPRSFLNSRQASIAGGTSEIMRNILGERVLGLPPEPKLDKGMAWSKVPRS
jgi:alkylation response protein AidB-like acyl-CoA dehydrogenase